MSLSRLGWGKFFARQLAVDDLPPARIISQERELYRLRTEHEEAGARLTGRLASACRERHDWPVVGDWVTVARRPEDPVAMIHRRLERRSAIVRKAVGERTVAQAMAANVDTVFIVESLVEAPNLRRVERQLAGIGESGAEGVVVLNKSDRCTEVEAAAARVRGHRFRCPDSRHQRGHR